MPGTQTIRLSSRLKFTGVPNVVIDEYTHKIGLNGLAMYTVLKKFADYEYGVCWPSIATVARICGVSRFTVMRLLGKLVDHGLLLKETGRKLGDTNAYTFLLPDVAQVRHVCSNRATGGVANLQHGNKEEREPLNETHRTRQNLSREREYENLPF